MTCRGFGEHLRVNKYLPVHGLPPSHRPNFRNESADSRQRTYTFLKRSTICLCIVAWLLPVSPKTSMAKTSVFPLRTTFSCTRTASYSLKTSYSIDTTATRGAFHCAMISISIRSRWPRNPLNRTLILLDVNPILKNSPPCEFRKRT